MTLFRLENWSQVASLSTLTGLYFGRWSRGDKKEDAKHVAETRKKIAAGVPGFSEAFVTFAGTVICAYDWHHKREKERLASAKVVKDGEVVKIEKKKYRIKVMPGNSDWPRNSDPIHLIPVKS